MNKKHLYFGFFFLAALLASFNALQVRYPLTCLILTFKHVGVMMLLLQVMFLIATNSRKNDSFPAACLDVSMFALADEARKELCCSFFGGCDGDECVRHVGATICFFPLMVVSAATCNLVSGICETSPNMQLD